MKKFSLKIVTQEREIYSGQVYQATLPAAEGEITILADHMPLVTSLKTGQVLIKEEGQDKLMALSGGSVKVDERGVVVLADSVQMAEEIQEKEVLKAKESAEKLMREKKMDAKEFAALAAELEKELTRLKVVRKWKKHRGSQIKEE